jgi:hypothetical protein
MKNTGKAMKYPKGGAANKRPGNPGVKHDGRHKQGKTKRPCGDRHK